MSKSKRKSQEIKPCTEIKTKLRETLKDGRKVYIEEKYYLTRKIKRRRAKERLKAMDVKHPCRWEYNRLTGDYLPSSLATHWREYGAEV